MQLRGKQLHVSATTPRHTAPLGRHHLVTKGAVHHRQLKSEPGRAGNPLLFVLPKYHGPCILSSRLQKVTVTLQILSKIKCLKSCKTLCFTGHKHTTYSLISTTLFPTSLACKHIAPVSHHRTKTR